MGTLKQNLNTFKEWVVPSTKPKVFQRMEFVYKVRSKWKYINTFFNNHGIIKYNCKNYFLYKNFEDVFGGQENCGMLHIKFIFILLYGLCF